MAEYKDQEKGVKEKLSIESNRDFEDFLGVYKQQDPGAIPDGALQDAINVRIVGGRIDNRWGQEKMSSSALASCVFGMHDDENGEIVSARLYVTGGEAAGGVNLRIGSITEGDSPEYADLNASNDLSGQPICIAEYDSGLVIFHGSTCYSVDLSSGALTSLFTGHSGVHFAVEHDSKLWFVKRNSASIFYWDGATVTTDSTTAGLSTVGQDDNIVLASHNSDLYVCAGKLSGLTSFIKRRNSGAYTSLTMPGGMTLFQPTGKPVTFGSSLYVPGLDRNIGATTGGQGKILAVDASFNVTVARSLDRYLDGGLGVLPCLESFDSKLCYAHTPNNSSSGAKIGTYDGASWSDAVKNLATQYSGIDITGLFLATDGINLYLSVKDVVVDANPCVVASPSTDLAGTWTTEITNAKMNANGTIFMVYI